MPNGPHGPLAPGRGRAYAVLCCKAQVNSLLRCGTPLRLQGLPEASRNFQSRTYSSRGGALFAGRPARRFFAPGGGLRAAGLLGEGLCARLSQRRGRDEGRGGRSASRAKAPGTFARGELSFPPFFGDPKKGGAGVAGVRSPRGEAWASQRSALRTAARPTCTGRALAPLGIAPTKMR